MIYFMDRTSLTFGIIKLHVSFTSKIRKTVKTQTVQSLVKNTKKTSWIIFIYIGHRGQDPVIQNTKGLMSTVIKLVLASDEAITEASPKVCTEAGTKARAKAGTNVVSKAITLA